MKIYQHILLALDLHPEHDLATETRAVDISKESGAKLSIIHAVEHVTSYGAAFAYPALADLEEQVLAEAKIQLAECGSRLDVAIENQYVELGSPKSVLIDTAKRIGTDLIVVGSHTRHAFQFFLGSTVNAILHEAPCDVLAVRLSD